MKKIVTLLLTLTLTTGIASAEPFVAPDIMVDTKLDADWSGVLVARLRRLLKNFGVDDPFRQRYSEPLIVSDALIQEYLDPSAVELVTDLGHIVGLDILNGKSQVALHGLYYDIKGFKTQLESNEEKKDGVVLSTELSASKVRVSADKVRLTLLLPGKNALPVINIDVKKPVITASGDKLMNLMAKVKIQDANEVFKLLVEDASFLNMAKSLVSDKNSLSLEFEGLEIPDLSIKIGNRTISIDKKKIETLLNARKEGIKSLLIGQFASMLNNGMVSDLIKSVGKVEFKKEHWFDTVDLQTGIRIDSFSNGNDDRHLEVALFGEFCTNELYKQYEKKCVDHIKTLPPVSRIDRKTFEGSKRIMRQEIESGNANIVVSISEDYVNKILMGTYDAGLWEPILKEAGLKMGEGKVQFRLEQKGAKTGTVYLDIMYTPKKIERLAIGAKEVRFPVVLQAGLKIKLNEKKKFEPVIVIGLADIDMSDETLLMGRPDLGMPSNLHTIRLKKKVLKTIRAELAKLANTDVLELPFPELRGLGLEAVEFVSDGQGRMNALMRLENHWQKFLTPQE